VDSVLAALFHGSLCEHQRGRTTEEMRGQVASRTLPPRSYTVCPSMYWHVLHRSGYCPPSTSRGLADRARMRGWLRVAEATSRLSPLQIPQEQCKVKRPVPEMLAAGGPRPHFSGRNQLTRPRRSAFLKPLLIPTTLPRAGGEAQQNQGRVQRGKSSRAAWERYRQRNKQVRNGVKDG
jgi:hypothetical protein